VLLSPSADPSPRFAIRREGERATLEAAVLWFSDLDVSTVPAVPSTRGRVRFRGEEVHDRHRDRLPRGAGLRWLRCHLDLGLDRRSETLLFPVGKVRQGSQFFSDGASYKRRNAFAAVRANLSQEFGCPPVELGSDDLCLRR